MFEFSTTGPKARVIYAALLVGSLCACKTGGGGGVNNDGLVDSATTCVSNLTGSFAELPILSSLALDNLSLDQLSIVTNSLGSLTNLPISGLGDLLDAVDTGAITEALALCNLEDSLNSAGVTDPTQLVPGGLTDLLSALAPLDLNSLLAGLGDLGLGSIGDLLNGLQDGSILSRDVSGLFLDALTEAGVAGPLLSAGDLFAPGLQGVLDALGGGLPGGLDSLLPADILDIANAVDASNLQGSTDPLTAVLSGITDVLSADAASALTVTVLGTLIGSAPDLFANGLSDVLDQLSGGLPGGIDGLLPADILDLASALNVANSGGATDQLEAVLGTITGGLSTDEAAALTSTVLGSLGGLLGQG